MTPQEIFDKALSGVLKQGEPALKPNRSCDYYVEGTGKMCAVGLLLGPEIAKQWSDWRVGEVADVEDSDMCEVVVPDWVKGNMNLLMRIQTAHDIFLNDGQTLDTEYWRSEFIRKMKEIAYDRKLTYKEELEHV